MINKKGQITIIAKNMNIKAMNKIQDDAGIIKNTAGKRFIQKGNEGIVHGKTIPPKDDLRVMKIDGPFSRQTKEKVDKIEKGIPYDFKVTQYNRQPRADELKKLKWNIKYDDTTIIPLPNVTGNEVITITFNNKLNTKKIQIYAYFKKPIDDVSVISIFKLPMLIIQSIGRKGKKKGTSETAVDLMYNDYSEDVEGYDKLYEEIYNEVYNNNKSGGLFTSRENFAKDKANEVKNKVVSFCDKTDEELFELFESDAKTYFSTGKLEDNIINMIKRMKNKLGGEYINNELTNAVIKHENTKLFINNVKKWVRPFLTKYKNSIENLRIVDDSEGIIYHSDFKDKVDKPKFNNRTDTISGIQIATNDIWAYEIYLNDYYFVGNEPHGSLLFEFYDHFGLDYPDIEKYQNDIFIAWFVLQHFRGYPPFITRMSFTSKF